MLARIGRRIAELLRLRRSRQVDRLPDDILASEPGVVEMVDDAEMLDLCGRAGLTRVFIGIETPNEESLRETGKRQNVGVDLLDQIQAFLDHGVSVTAGMIETEQSHLFYGEGDARARVAATVPLARLGTPRDVADACLFLASPLAAYVSGASLLVHGGGERPAFLDAAK